MNANCVEVLNKKGEYKFFEEGYIGFFGYIVYNCDCEDSYECDCDGEEFLCHIFFDKDKVFQGVIIDRHSVDYEHLIPDILNEKQDDIDDINEYEILFHRYKKDGYIVEEEIKK